MERAHSLAACALGLTLLFVLAACDSTEPRSGDLNQPGLGLNSIASEASGVSEDSLRARITRSGGLAIVGFKEVGGLEGVARGRILVRPGTLVAAHALVRGLRGVTVVAVDELLPTLLIRIQDGAALTQLLRSALVEYVEPAGVPGGASIWQSSDGCGDGDPNTEVVPVVPGGDRIATRLLGIGVERAWAYATGEGVSVAVIGTGVSQYQSQLVGTEFTSGQSAGRVPVNKDWTWDGATPPWHDDCGHETRIIGNIAAPRDGQGMVGIAYRATIHSIRIDNDVALQGGWHAKMAIRAGAQTSRIVNMAFGWPAYSLTESS